MPAVPKQANSSPFSDYSAYVSKLKHLSLESHLAADWDMRVHAALNGQAGAELRLAAPLETRRKFGAFFTGTDLGAKLIGCGTGFGPKSVFYDPTCGMGDLLIAAARQLPICKSLPKTLKQWGQQLSGTDLHQEFIDGTRTRLVLLARQRHKSDEVLQISNAEFFPNIRVADGLKQAALFSRATHLLLNPPFGQVAAPPDCKWAGGRITEAAAFVIAALEQAKPGAELLAILPDVLRSGSFSEHWRNRVGALAEVLLVEPYGIFDDSADVDVFLLRLVKRPTEVAADNRVWANHASTRGATIGDFFEVHVGRVVPHRDPESGPSHPYIHARSVPAWTIMDTFAEKRHHSGLVYKTPFVAIRRTSRPGHPYRATATIIAGKTPVAVENHLIVCTPKDGKLATCRKLMWHLKSEIINDCLNQRIRCRHLTVASVRELPWEVTK